MSVAAPVSASQAIGEYLQSPDDLLKIAAFRKKLEKEKASLDTRLQSGVKEQLEATREGLKKLFATRNNVQVVMDEMQTVDRLCNDPQNVVSTFDQISNVSMVHRNFEQTEEMVNNLLEMNSKLDQLEDMLATDSADILGPATHMLPLHYQLNRLEAFRNQVMHIAKKASAESRSKLSRIFGRLNKLISNFDAYVVQLGRNVLSIVRAGHPEVIVKLIKVAEMEGREDEKAIAIRLVKKAAKMDAASKFKSMQADARVIKHYRPKIMTAISGSIKSKFEDSYANDKDDPSAFLDSLGWIYQDLIRIESDVVPCFPPSYEIYAFYVKEYHKNINTVLKQLLSAEPEASILLHVHAWIKEYKKSTKELDVPPELLDPPLLNGEEQNLIEDYLKLIVKKLDEWTANLMKTETEEFTTRSEPPEMDSDGLYGTQGAVILFQMVNQQIDAATESGQGAILARVVGEVNRTMRNIQDRWIRLIGSELKKQTEKPEEVAGGLAEYCIALANDQLKCVDYTQALLGRLEPLVSEKYRVPINEKLNDAMDGYIDVARKCLQAFIDIIFNDLKPATKQLFQQPWYDGIIVQIVETMRDYMAEETYLNSSLHDSIVDYLLDGFLVVYLTALGNATKLRIPAATQRIKEDVTATFTFFCAYRPAKDLEPDFEVIEMVLSMLEASKSMVFLSFWSFAKVHGPNLSFVEGILRARSDLDRSSVNEIMESIKRKVKEEALSEPPEPTIMKRITVQGALSRFLRTQ